MKNYNHAIALVVGLIVSGLCANVPTIPNNITLFIKNEYKSPIILNINGQEAALIQINNQIQLYEWPRQIKIRTDKFGSMYDNRIHKEIEKIWEKTQETPNIPILATTTILNTNSFTHFDYRTEVTPTIVRPSAGLNQVQQNTAVWNKLISEIKRTGNINSFLKFITDNNPYGDIASKKILLMQHVIFDNNPGENPIIPSLTKDIINYINSKKEVTAEEFYNKISELIFSTYEKMGSLEERGQVTFPRSPGIDQFRQYSQQMRPMK